MVEKYLAVQSVSMLGSVQVHNYQGLYFGNEFCENRLPSRSELKEACDFAAGKSLSFCWATCYVSGRALQSVMDRVSVLPRDAQVTVNDWGLLNALGRTGGRRVNLGRLLTKQTREPRLIQVWRKLPRWGRKKFREVFIGDAYASLLRGYGVGMVEVDNPLQGIELDSALECALHVPYAYVTTSKKCQFASTGTSCGRACVGRSFGIRSSKMRVDFHVQGNAWFYRNDKMSNIPVRRVIVHENQMSD